ncbi:hypothetical protein H9P43_002124 [Blastocladiella emersonii ATCC 22665]|nr:hypothetical protein H9P43_002124 [Blastocladiella emersonii ATCC 22665]
MSAPLLNIMKRLRLVVNPSAVEPDIWGGSFRTPAPASQPKYIPPETENDAISNNYYFQRDHRRNYPQTTVYANPTAPALAAGADVKALPTGPGMAVIAPTVEEIRAVADSIPLPPSISHKQWNRSADSAMPTDSPTTYFHVTGYN